MKRSLLMMLVGLSLMSGLFSCQQPAEKPAKEMPMFCTWYTYNEKEDFMWLLFGIDTTPQETLDYWGE